MEVSLHRVERIKQKEVEKTKGDEIVFLGDREGVRVRRDATMRCYPAIQLGFVTGLWAN